MLNTSRLIGFALIIATYCCAPVLAQQPRLVPLDDTKAAEPLEPIGISQEMPECFGQYVHLWTLEDGTEVIQYYGDFSLHLGERRMLAQDAVIWMQPAKWEAVDYYHYEVYLSNNAQVRESAGTITNGAVLFVTFNAMKSPLLARDIDARESSQDSSLYIEGMKVRTAMHAERSNDAEMVDMTVLKPGRKTSRQPDEKQKLVTVTADKKKYSEDTNLITAIGHVYVSQGAVDSQMFLEMRADAAVVFLKERKNAKATSPPPPPSEDAGETPASDKPFPEEFPAGESTGESATSESSDGAAGDSMGLDQGLGGPVSGVYLKGDVVLTQGERMIRASEIYYDFENHRALMLDAVMRAVVPQTELPIYVRATQVRQLSQTEFSVRKAKVSTSEFNTPHIHLGAEQLNLTDSTARDQTGQISGVNAAYFEVQHSTLNIEGVPVAYWPYGAGNFEQSETAIASIGGGYDSDFGASFLTKWHMFNLLGLEKPEGVESLLLTDYFGDRGAGIGNDTTYRTEDAYGTLRTYYIHDHGEDNLGPLRSGPPDQKDRGRATIRHRQLFEEGWELTLEASYQSDPTFLEEYFNPEFEEGKEQETLVYLKKQQDNWAFTTLAKWRVNDWQSQVESLPDAGFNLIGEPLGDVANYYNETHAGLMRMRPDERRLFNHNRQIDNTGSSDTTPRAETRNEVDFPIKLDSLNLVPFVVGRYGGWDGSPFASSVDRTFGMVGIKAGTQLWKLCEDAKCELLDVNGIRHVIKPEVTAWYSESNVGSFDLHPFTDGVETIDDFYGASVALRQRWQTKRGAPGKWEVVDWITLDVEAGFFGNVPDNRKDIGRFYDSRPENSQARNHLRMDGTYRISDTTSLLGDANYDFNDGQLDIANVSYAVERSPRFSYMAGYRYIGDTDSNLLGGGFNYRINVKHTMGVRSYFDIERGEAETFDITLLRKFPRWYAAVVFGVDNIEDSVSVSLSAWPEGAPQAALGTRKYTGLANSIGIKQVE